MGDGIWVMGVVFLYTYIYFCDILLSHAGNLQLVLFHGWANLESFPLKRSSVFIKSYAESRFKICPLMIDQHSDGSRIHL